ncbi:helix-hairpin-helix domain-containing protein [Streptomyces sp. NPDC032472]|uniref:helix-hairpin-helix domain-containing protein n=1 Tax=Streptomyces sp. NPDC032472 TaxID=3155018 RepID=UPI0033C55AD6
MSTDRHPAAPEATPAPDTPQAAPTRPEAGADGPAPGGGAAGEAGAQAGAGGSAAATTGTPQADPAPGDPAQGEADADGPERAAGSTGEAGDGDDPQADADDNEPATTGAPQADPATGAAGGGEAAQGDAEADGPAPAGGATGEAESGNDSQAGADDNEPATTGTPQPDPATHAAQGEAEADGPAQAGSAAGEAGDGDDSQAGAGGNGAAATEAPDPATSDADADGPAPAGGAAGEAGDADGSPSGAAGNGAAARAPHAGGEAALGDAEVGGGPGAESPVSGRGGVGESPAGDGDGPQLSEAEAELAAQKVERERIERRKAQRQGPVDAGAKLSGKAADLLAAVRAVESGEKPAPRYFDDAEGGARRPAPAPAPQSQPQPQPRPRPAAAPEPSAEGVEAVRAVLARGGAPAELAARAAAALGEAAAEELAENPWRLLAVTGVRPTQADGFARALLGPAAGPADDRRAAALVGWLLEQAALKGHTALEAPTLESALAQYGVPRPADALEQAIAEGLVLVFHEPLDTPAAPSAAPSAAQDDAEDGEEDDAQPVRVLVGLEGYALAEESLADGLARLAGTFAGPADWDGAATGPGAELIRAVAGHGLVVHTGGEAARAEPLALVAAARERGLRTCLAAHAPGRREAVTVAGLLAGTEGPQRDADGQFELDLLVVLDAPQLDVETAAALVESVPDGARLVLSGDPSVLGSAGPGRVFADLLAARACPQLVSRIPDPGPLGELVSGIGIGELNQVDAPGKEVVIVPVRDAGEAVHRTVQLVAESVPRAFGIAADGIQVITPGHGGPAGTRALNAALKERLNPGPGRFGGFDPGDRVVHVPSPGRAVPGHVVSADAEGLHLDTAGGRIVVPRERVEAQVRHGWAVTAHQAVGARWPAVVAVLPGDAAQALSRDWVYTAFGRAERHLSVVHGVDQALAHAVAQVLPKPRTTRLAGLLRALTAAAQEQPE